MTQRDDMGRVVGRGFRVGNSCTPVVDSCQRMAKPIQYCKVKKKIKIKIIKINKIKMQKKIPSIDSMQFLSKFQWHFLEVCISKSKQKTPKTYMEMQKPKVAETLEKERSWRSCHNLIPRFIMKPW